MPPATQMDETMLSDFFQIVMQVPALDPVIAAYRDLLGFSVVDEGTIPNDLAQLWSAPLSAGKRFALFQPASGAKSWIRCIEAPGLGPTPGSLGWNGIEILVQDLSAIERRLGGTAFSVFSPRQTLSMSDKVQFMQVIGPAGELLFLNQMDEPSFRLGRAASPVDRPFVVTCGALHVENVLRWFRDTFAMVVDKPFPVTMPALNKIFGFAEGTQHRLGMVRLKGPCILEMDEYPASAKPKFWEPGELPTGIGVVSVSVEDLNPILQRVGEKPVSIDAPPYYGARAILLTIPGPALLEVVERVSMLSA